MKLNYISLIFLTFTFSNSIYADEKSEKVQLELDKKCEVAREKKIKPLRDNLISKCVTEQRKSKEHCTSYYSTYGDPMQHGNGGVTPRMFHDLPECLKAFDYSRSYRSGR